MTATQPTAAEVWADPQLAAVTRDRWGRPVIPPADGEGKPTAHVRATTMAKALADANGLIAWKQRVTAVGLAQRPDLLAAIAADPTDNRSVGRHADAAAEAGGASAAATLGTAVHGFVERVNRGQTPDVPAPWDADVNAYTEALAAAGLEVDPAMVERLCVTPQATVAGTPDMIVSHPSWPLPRIADLKTGKSTQYGTGEWSIQLALYAHAATLYDPVNGHTPMPAVDQATAILVHLPVGTGECTIFELDIARGWEMVETCIAVRDWRKAKGLLTRLDLEAAPAAAPAPILPPPDADPARQVGPLEHDTADDRIAHLAGRITALRSHDGALQQVAERWPNGVPTIKAHLAGDARLEAHALDQIDRILTAVEGNVQAPFASDIDPGGPLPASDPRVVAVKARIVDLPVDLASDLATAAALERVPKLTGGTATVAHLDTVTAMLGDLEATYIERLEALEAAAAVTGLGERDLVAAAGTRLPVTAAEVATISAIADAAQLDALEVHGGQVTVAAGAIDALVERHGGKRPLLAAARQLATDLGITKPKSSVDIASSIPLVAHLVLAEPATAPTA